MATTTNYGWTTPDDTGLVKDGASAIRSLGTSVDTTTKNLNPSTTLGDIEYRSSTANTNTRLAIGSTGNVLTVAGGVPTWAAPAASGGGMTLISTTNLSGSSTITLSSIPSTYTNLQIQIQGMTNNTGNGYLTFDFGTASDMQYTFLNDGTAGSVAGGSDLQTPTTILRTNGENGFLLTIFNYSSSIINHSFSYIGSYTSAAPALRKFAAFGTDGSSGIAHTISSINITQGGGTFSAGTVKLWGIK